MVSFCTAWPTLTRYFPLNVNVNSKAKKTYGYLLSNVLLLFDWYPFLDTLIGLLADDQAIILKHPVFMYVHLDGAQHWRPERTKPKNSSGTDQEVGRRISAYPGESQFLGSFGIKSHPANRISIVCSFYARIGMYRLLLGAFRYSELLLFFHRY